MKSLTLFLYAVFHLCAANPETFETIVMPWSNYRYPPAIQQMLPALPAEAARQDGLWVTVVTREPATTRIDQLRITVKFRRPDGALATQTQYSPMTTCPSGADPKVPCRVTNEIFKIGVTDYKTVTVTVEPIEYKAVDVDVDAEDERK